MIHTIRAEMVANVLEVSVADGDRISVGDTLLLLESMKMEIPVLAEVAGEVVEVAVSVGDVIQEGDPLVLIKIESARNGKNSR
ncbi:MAG: biotin/lipoyl-binding carrier protein [Actinomycetota bacterium]